MYLHIVATNGVPVYEQIARQIAFLIADETLPPGDMIPSVRQLARDLAINPNTVARAYRHLQDLQVVETLSGTGLQVTAQGPAICRQERAAWIRTRFRHVVVEARSSRLSEGEIRQIFEQILTAASAEERRP